MTTVAISSIKPVREHNKFNDNTIQDAVQLYFTDPEGYHRICGRMEDWDTSEVTDMSSLFDVETMVRHSRLPIPPIPDLRKWDVSGVVDFSRMFAYSSIDQNLNMWDVSSALSFHSMFIGAERFDCDLNNWNVSNAKTMSSMFQKAFRFNGNISSWDVSNLNDSSCMFAEAVRFNGNISNWDVSNVKYAQNMFSSACSFNCDISKWKVSQVLFMRRMFYKAVNFNCDLGSWNLPLQVSRSPSTWNHSLKQSLISDRSSSVFLTEIVNKGKYSEQMAKKFNLPYPTPFISWKTAVLFLLYSFIEHEHITDGIQLGTYIGNQTDEQLVGVKRKPRQQITPDTDVDSSPEAIRCRIQTLLLQSYVIGVRGIRLLIRSFILSSN